MTSKEALDKIKYIDLHGQFPYNYYLKDDLEYKEVLEILDIALEQAQKQEELLELYRDLMTAKDELMSIAYFGQDYYVNRETERELEQRIKELESEVDYGL